jgi:hypothetical protein
LMNTRGMIDLQRRGAAIATMGTMPLPQTLHVDIRPVRIHFHLVHR